MRSSVEKFRDGSENYQRLTSQKRTNTAFFERSKQSSLYLYFSFGGEEKEMKKVFERALKEIEENSDKLPLDPDVLRAYQIATDEYYDEYLREQCIIDLLKLLRQQKEH